jgi:hypothetical protein
VSTLEFVLLVVSLAGTVATILWIERDHAARRARLRAEAAQRDFEWLRANGFAQRGDEHQDFNNGEGI